MDGLFTYLYKTQAAIIVFRDWLDEKDINSFKAQSLKLKIEEDDRSKYVYFEYPNGWMHGEFCDYVGDILKFKSNYVNGIQHGKKIEYYDNGVPKTIVHYVNGQRHGKYIAYNIEGEINTEIVYEREFTHGLERCYYDSSKTLIFERNWDNNVLHGPYTGYNQGNSIIIKSIYNKGKLDGEYIEYDDSGQVLLSCVFINGKKQGKQKSIT